MPSPKLWLARSRRKTSVPRFKVKLLRESEFHNWLRFITGGVCPTYQPAYMLHVKKFTCFLRRDTVGILREGPGALWDLAKVHVFPVLIAAPAQPKVRVYEPIFPRQDHVKLRAPLLP